MREGPITSWRNEASSAPSDQESEEQSRGLRVTEELMTGGHRTPKSLSTLECTNKPERLWIAMRVQSSFEVHEYLHNTYMQNSQESGR